MKITTVPVAVFATLLGLACGPTPAPTTTATIKPAPPKPAPPKPAPPKPAPPKTQNDKCVGGDVHACDAIVEYWSERAFVPAAQSAKGKTDARTLHHACDKRNLASACMGLALMYKRGAATGKSDRVTSKNYWKRVAALRSINGFRGKPLSSEGALVLATTEAACTKGRAHACIQAGWAAYSAVQRAKSIADAYVHYARACELGSGKGCHWAGHFAYAYPDLKLNDNPAALLRRGCKVLNAPGACDELGLYLEKVAKTPAPALPLFKAACTAGVRAGCFHLGLAKDRKGAALDATELLLKACTVGEKRACAALAVKVTQSCSIDLGSSPPAAVGANALAAAKRFCKKVTDAPNCKHVAACP